MFFEAAKVFWFLITPSNLITILAVVGFAAACTGRRRTGHGLLAVALAALLILGLSPVSTLALRTLEDRFLPVAPEQLGKVDGIIVLGGSLNITRGQPKLNDAGARMTGAIALARRFPDARVVFSGGSGRLFHLDDDENEGDASRLLVNALGLEGPRVLYEDRSRNTRENAEFTKAMVKPRPGERWVLVTSAFHMPRSVGIFRDIGFDVIPYPVDFITKGRPSDFMPLGAVSAGLRQMDLAVKEWVGLVVYRLAGYTDTLFPGPSQPKVASL